MSKYDLLNEWDLARATKQGWVLAFVIDEKTKRVTAELLAAPFTPNLPDVSAARRYVATQAKTGNNVALRALRAMLASNVKTKRK